MNEFDSAPGERDVLLLLALERAVDAAGYDGGVLGREVIGQLRGTLLEQGNFVYSRLKQLAANGGLVVVDVRDRQRFYDIGLEGDAWLKHLAEVGELPELPESPDHRKWVTRRAAAAEIVDDCYRAAAFLALWAQQAVEAGNFVELQEVSEALQVAGHELALCRFALNDWPEPELGRPLGGLNLRAHMDMSMPERYRYPLGPVTQASIGWS